MVAPEGGHNGAVEDGGGSSGSGLPVITAPPVMPDAGSVEAQRARTIPPAMPPGAAAGDAQSSIGRLLTDALGNISRLEAEKLALAESAADAERRAREAERKVQDTILKLEEARRTAAAAESRQRELLGRLSSSPETSDGSSRELRELREELESTKAALEENFQEVASLRVHLRKAEEESGGSAALVKAAEERAAQATQAANAAAEEAGLRRVEIEHLQKELEAAQQSNVALVEESSRSRDNLTAIVTELNGLREQHDALQQAHQQLRAELDTTLAELAKSREETAGVGEQLAQTQQLLVRETDARVALEATRQVGLESTDRERKAAQRETEALGSLLLQAEEELTHLKAELAASQSQVSELLKAQELEVVEMARLKQALTESDAERKEILEKARKADREAKVRAKEVSALTEELKAVRATVPPGGASPGAPAAGAGDKAMAEELAKAKQRLALYGDEIKRLRAELAAVGKTE